MYICTHFDGRWDRFIDAVGARKICLPQEYLSVCELILCRIPANQSSEFLMQFFMRLKTQDWNKRPEVRPFDFVKVVFIFKCQWYFLVCCGVWGITTSWPRAILALKTWSNSGCRISFSKLLRRAYATVVSNFESISQCLSHTNVVVGNSKPPFPKHFFHAVGTQNMFQQSAALPIIPCSGSKYFHTHSHKASFHTTNLVFPSIVGSYHK